MIVFKIIFVLLLCVPVFYVAAYLWGRLVREAAGNANRKNKSRSGRTRSERRRY